MQYQYWLKQIIQYRSAKLSYDGLLNMNNNLQVMKQNSVYLAEQIHFSCDIKGFLHCIYIRGVQLNIPREGRLDLKVLFLRHKKPRCNEGIYTYLYLNNSK